jgi:hypothetical protein
VALKDMNEADGTSLIGNISSRFTGDFIVLTPKSPFFFRRTGRATRKDVTYGQFVSSIRWRNPAAQNVFHFLPPHR